MQRKTGMPFADADEVIKQSSYTVETVDFKTIEHPLKFCMYCGVLVNGLPGASRVRVAQSTTLTMGVLKMAPNRTQTATYESGTVQRPNQW